MTRAFLGVAASAHVQAAVDDDVCLFGHGSRAAVEDLEPGDWIVYYSPGEAIDGASDVQAFTAIGRVAAGDIEAFDRDGQRLHRRPATYSADAHQAPVRPLLDQLSFVEDPDNWGLAFRNSKRQITLGDVTTIAEAMGADGP